MTEWQSHGNTKNTINKYLEGTTYVVIHTEFEFSIKLGGYLAKILVFKILLWFVRQFFKTNVENRFWDMLSYVKPHADYEFDIRLA